LIAEALKIAFADRSAATGDPAFVNVPVAQLLAKDYAAARRGAIDLARASEQHAGVPVSTSSHTTHVTVADGDGNVVAATQTVEAPRVWTQGQELEVEHAVPDRVRAELTSRGHTVVPVARVGGGMCAIAWEPDGTLTGAACWRADGTAIGLGGGHARSGIR